MYVAYADNLNGSPVRYTEMKLTQVAIFIALDGSICVYSTHNSSFIGVTAFTVEHGTSKEVTLRCCCNIKRWLTEQQNA